MINVYNRRDKVLACFFDIALRPFAFIVKLIRRQRYQMIGRQGVNRILVIRLDNIGDVVMTTPLIRELKKIFKNAKIDILVNPYAAQVIKSNPNISNIYPYYAFWFNRSHMLWDSFKEFIQIIKILKRKRYDLVIEPRGDIRNILFAFILGTKRRLGFNRTGGSYMLTDVLDYKPGKHFIRHQQDLLTYLDNAKNYEDYTEVFETEYGSIEAREVYNQLKINDGKKIAAIFPCSKYSSKEWPEEKFADICSFLNRELGFLPVIFGMKKEFDKCEHIKNLSGKDTVNLAGKLSISGLISFLKRCKLVISNDSAPAHIAGALDLPLVVIWSAMDYNISAPHHKDKRKMRLVYKTLSCSFCNSIKILPKKCRKRKHPECVQTIEVKDVISAIKEVNI